MMQATWRRYSCLGLLVLLIGSVGTTLAVDIQTTPTAPPPAASPEHRPSPLFHGMWVWDSLYIKDPLEQQRMLAFCKRHQFNRLLIQIPWTAGSAQSMATLTPANPAAVAAPPTLSYETQLKQLIEDAAKAGIAVEALDGDPFMGRKEHWAETLATEQALIDFNNTLPAGSKLAGIHWDIEPYTRADWKTAQREQIMVEYVQLLRQAKQMLTKQAPAMTLAVDVPFWYDKPDDAGIGYDVEIDGTKKNLHEAIQDAVDYVGIMSYRRSADGDNGVVALVQADLDYAEKIGKFVCPALETVELDDSPQITFYGQPTAAFLQTQQSVWTQLQDRPGFGGMLIHFYPGIRAVLEPQPAAQAH